MTTQPDNLALLDQALARWHANDLDGYLRVYAPDIVLHGYAGVEPGLPSVRRFYEALWVAFPHSRLHLHDVFAHDDKVVARFAMTARHEGAFQGLPATGRAIELPGITILRFYGGQCVERWSQADFLGLMGQLGAL